MVFLAPPSSVILKGFNTGFIPVAIFSLLLVYSAFQSGLAAARISSGRLSERAWRHFFFKGRRQINGIISVILKVKDKNFAKFRSTNVMMHKSFNIDVL